MIKTLARPLLATVTMAMLAGCSSTPKVCSKPGAALNQVNAQLFFIQNAKKQGVQTSALGYQYKIIRKGNGKKNPSSGDTVLVNYVSRKLDGSVIDNGNRIALPVAKVIEGWKLALSEMVEGDSWIVYVPAQLAYGCKSQPSNSGFDEALMFDMELLKIQ